MLEEIHFCTDTRAMNTAHRIWCDGIQTRKISDRSDDANNLTLSTLFYALILAILSAMSFRAASVILIATLTIL